MSVTVADLLVRFGADTAGADRGFNSVNQQIGEFENRHRSAFGALSTVGTAAVGGAVTAVAALGAGMISTAVSGTKMASDLESQMDTIASVLGATEAEVQPLNDLILSLGINPNLKVGTLEAADAIETLATAGLSMAEIIDGAAESTVLLSNATGGDFAQAAEIMTDSMAIFKDSIGSYEDAVNGVVSVSNVSKFGVQDYALALASAGGVAGTAGVEFDDFNASIAAISPLFSSGSDAGTSFKTLLQRLIPQSNEATEAMAALGLITADGSNQFFDAGGNLKDMSEITVLLQDSLAGLTEEQRNQALSTIFGTDAMRAAVGLMDSGAVVYTDAAEAAAALGVSQEAVNAVIEDGVTAYEALQLQMAQTDSIDAAAQRMDNAKGAMEILGGVIETVQIAIGQAFLPVMKELATQLASFVTANSSRITSFFQTFAAGVAAAASFIPSLVSGLFGLIDVFAGVVQVISTYIATGELLSATEFGMSEGTAALVDGMTNFAATVVDVIGVIASFVQPVIQAIASFVSWQDVMVALGIAVASVVLPAIASFVAALAPVIATVAAVVGAVALLRNAWEADFLGIQTIVTGAVSSIGSTLGALGQYFAIVVEDGDYLNDFLTHLPDSIRPVVEWVGQTVAAFLNYRDAVLDAGSGSIESQESIGLFPAVLQPLIGLIDTLIGSFGNYVQAVRDTISAVQAAIQVVGQYIATGELLSASEFGVADSVAVLADTFAEFGANVYDAMVALYEVVRPTFERIGEAFGEMITGFADMGPALGELLSAFSGLWSAVEPILTALAQAIGVTLVGVVIVAGNIIASTFAVMADLVSNAITTMSGVIEGIADVVSGMVQLVVALVQGDWAAAWQGASTIVDGVVQIINSLLMGLLTQATLIWGAITSAVTNSLADMGLNMDALSASMSASWSSMWVSMQGTWDSTWAALGAGWTSLKTWLDTTFPGAMVIWGVAWDLSWALIQATWDAAWAAISAAWIEVQRWLTTTLPTALSSWGTTWDSAWNAINTSLTIIWSGIRSQWTIMQTWLTTTLPEALTKMKDDAAKQWESIKATIVDKLGLVIGTFNNVKTWLDSTLQTAFNTFKTFLSGISLPNPFAALSGSISGITSAIQSAKNAVNEYIAWLSNLSIPNPLSGILGGGDEEKSKGEEKSNGGRSNRGAGLGLGSSLLTPVADALRPLAPVNLSLFGMDKFPVVGDSSLDFGNGAALRPLVQREAGDGRLNIDDMAEAIVRALRAEPMAVTVNIAATMTGDADVSRLSYDVARRISDIIQRRTA